VSAKAQKAVEDAMVVASRLKAAGHNREAEIIRRVCRSNVSYRITLRQLWVDNMTLRDIDGENCPQPEGDGPLLIELETSTAPVWCEQCERRVTQACASPFCKAKALAA
jgi:hypothetical protein